MLAFRIDALGHGIMATAILIMLATVLLVVAIGWHGRGRWY
jgi:hypothetical protein